MKKKTLSKLLCMIVSMCLIVNFSFIHFPASANLSELADLKESITAAFKAYVEQTGNAVTPTGMLEAARSALNSGTASFANGSSDYFIKHAIPGVYDEDPDPSTRLVIRGYDGYVAAVFTISTGGETFKVGAVARIPHTVENLGVLTKSDPAHFTINANGDVSGYTGPAVEKLIIPDTASGSLLSTAIPPAVSGGVKVVIMQNHGASLYKEVFRHNNNGSNWGSLTAVVVNPEVRYLSAGPTGPLTYTNGGRIFQNCINLKYVQMPMVAAQTTNPNVPVVGYGMLSECQKLENLTTPEGEYPFKNALTYDQYIFNNIAIRDFYVDSNATVSKMSASKTLRQYFAEPTNAPGAQDHGFYSSFAGGVRTVVLSDDPLTLSRAATLAQAKADSLVYDTEMTAESIKAAIEASYDDSTITLEWDSNGYDGDYSDDNIGGTLILKSGSDEIPIEFYRNISKTITDLKVDGFTLTPSKFNSSILNYEVTVPYSVESLNVTVTPVEGATVGTITGNTGFTVGSNNLISIPVTDTDGVLKTYTIKVTRRAEDTLETVKNRLIEVAKEDKFNNDIDSSKLLQALQEVIYEDKYSIEIKEFYKHKAIGGAKDDTGILVPGLDGYVTAVVTLSDGQSSIDIPLKSKIIAPMQHYIFASVSKPSDFELTSDGKILLAYNGNAEKVIIPEGVETFDGLWSVGAELMNIKALILPESLKELPMALGYGMKKLEVVYMGDNVVNAEADVFDRCVSLRYLRLSENLKIITSNMFHATLSLGSLYIPDSVETIKNNAFYRSMIRDVTLSANLKELGSTVFSWPANNVLYFSQPILGSVVTEEEAQELKDYCNSIAYENGKNVPRVVTVLNPELTFVGGTFHTDKSGAWAPIIVRGAEGSTTDDHISSISVSDVPSYEVAKEKFEYLNMNITEAAARAQFKADRLIFTNDSTANDVLNTIKAAYISQKVSGITWKEDFNLTKSTATTEGVVTGVLQMSNADGLTFDIEINGIIKPVKEVSEPSNPTEPSEPTQPSDPTEPGDYPLNIAAGVKGVVLDIKSKTVKVAENTTVKQLINALVLDEGYYVEFYDANGELISSDKYATVKLTDGMMMKLFDGDKVLFDTFAIKIDSNTNPRTGSDSIAITAVWFLFTAIIICIVMREKYIRKNVSQ